MSIFCPTWCSQSLKTEESESQDCASLTPKYHNSWVLTHMKIQQNLGIMFFSSLPKWLVSVYTFRGGMDVFWCKTEGVHSRTKHVASNITTLGSLKCTTTFAWWSSRARTNSMWSMSPTLLNTRWSATMAAWFATPTQPQCVQTYTRAIDFRRFKQTYIPCSMFKCSWIFGIHVSTCFNKIWDLCTPSIHDMLWPPSVEINFFPNWWIWFQMDQPYLLQAKFQQKNDSNNGSFF